MEPMSDAKPPHIPAYARRGRILQPTLPRFERPIMIDRGFFQILREDFLPPFSGRKKKRTRR